MKLIFSLICALSVIEAQESETLLNACLQLPTADATSYDFIVVGGGTAGSVVAGRLSEIDDFDILVLEAGGDPTGNPNIEIPLLYPNTFRGGFDWEYYTEPQKSACKSNIRDGCYMGGGKILGGSSCTNGMVAVRGGQADYVRWVNEGATGWGYEDVLKYFKKCENNLNATLAASPYHGVGGPISVSESLRTEVGTAFLDAYAQAGFVIGDINGPEEFVFGLAQMNVDGVRMDGYTRYLRPVKDQANVNVQTYSLVTKILFDGTNAIGVEVRKDGVTRIVCARKEVIMSAGVIRTPQLLMLSGVGPKEQLNKFGIEIVREMAGIGEGLEDHPTLLLPYTITAKISATPGKIASSEVWAEYQASKTGLLSSNLNEVSGSYGPDPVYNQRLIQVGLASTFLLAGELLAAVETNVDEQARADFKYNVGRFPPGQEGFTLVVILLHQRYPGWVRLNNTDPSADPLIDPRFLEHPDDMAILVAAVQENLKVIEDSKSMQDIGAEFVVERLTACLEWEYPSDEYIKCLISEHIISGNHPSSTCKMGDPNDPMAVLDPELKMIGVGRLRIVDASVMPHVISGNTNLVTVMIGEKAADIIKANYGY